jgi:integrase
VCWARDSGGVSKQQVSNLISGIGLLAPHLKKEGHLALAKRSLDGWSRCRPTISHTPVPWSVLTVLCAFLVRHGFRLEAYALLIGFHCYLRHSDIRGLRVKDVAFNGDPRVLVPKKNQALLFLKKFYNKGGRDQHVMVDRPLFVDILKEATRGRSAQERLFPTHNYRLLKLFKWAQLELGWDYLFDIHSLRHAGPADDFLSGRREVERIRMRGRWSNPKITERYLQELQALMVAVEGPDSFQVLQALVNRDETSLRRFLGLGRVNDHRLQGWPHDTT